jgi:hypothetical protein
VSVACSYVFCGLLLRVLWPAPTCSVACSYVFCGLLLRVVWLAPTCSVACSYVFCGLLLRVLWPAPKHLSWISWGEIKVNQKYFSCGSSIQFRVMDSPYVASRSVIGHTALGRNPLDDWSALRIDLYLTTHNTHNRKTFKPPAGFEPPIPGGEWPQIHVLDGAATGIGPRKLQYVPCTIVEITYADSYFLSP